MDIDQTMALLIEEENAMRFKSNESDPERGLHKEEYEALERKV